MAAYEFSPILTRHAGKRKRIASPATSAYLLRGRKAVEWVDSPGLSLVRQVISRVASFVAETGT